MTDNRNVNWLAALFLFISGDIQANTVSTVNITGVVQQIANCSVNNGAPVYVDFGNVYIDQVNGVNYAQPVTFTLNCSGLPTPSLRLQLTGTGAYFDATLLSTSVNDLGVAFKNSSGNPIALNTTWNNFTYPSLPVVNAVPVKRSGSTLPTGAFTAAATLVIEQQ